MGIAGCVGSPTTFSRYFTLLSGVHRRKASTTAIRLRRTTARTFSAATTTAATATATATATAAAAAATLTARILILITSSGRL